MTSTPPNFFLQRLHSLERATSWGGRRYWVLSRALCVFRAFPAPSAARHSLRNFAAIKAREWAPFADVGFHAHLAGEMAAIWAWDGGRVRDAMADTELTSSRITVLPEPTVRARGDNGVRVVDCLDGCEGQVWADGELQASRWWPQPPSIPQWIEFQRASGASSHDLNEIVPLPESSNWRRRPWTNSGEGLSSSLARRQRELSAVGTGALLAGYGYFGGLLGHDAAALSRLEARIRTVEQEKAPVVEDRLHAIRSRDFLTGYETLSPYPSQLALFARVADELPKNGARITAWSYDEGQLQFTIMTQIPADILFYVKKYSAVKGFTNVTADRVDGDRNLRIKLRLAP